MAVSSPFISVVECVQIRYSNDRAFWSNGPDWPQFGEIDIMEVSSKVRYKFKVLSLTT